VGQQKNTSWGHSDIVETGALVHVPTLGEMTSWRTRRLVAGALLIVAAVTGAYIGIVGASEADDTGSGGALVTLLTVGASLVIGFFGLRYLILGLRGKGVRLYQRALEADFPGRFFIIPERRLVPLLRVEVSGTAAATRAMAISSTGHAFALPAPFVEKADVWTLGSLGTRPVAPGGRAAKDLYERGELEPIREPTPEPPYHGPPWPKTPPLPRDVVVEEPDVRPVTPEPPPAPPEAPPAPIPAPPHPKVPTAAPVARPAPSPIAPPVELPSEPPKPPITLPAPSQAPPPIPPEIAPPEELPSEPPAPRPEAPREPPEVEEGWELEELPPSEVPAPPAEPKSGDEWELEELPPPTGEVEEAPDKPPRSGGWEWEEL
jgi:hypothetical protein